MNKIDERFFNALMKKYPLEEDEKRFLRNYFTNLKNEILLIIGDKDA